MPLSAMQVEILVSTRNSLNLYIASSVKNMEDSLELLISASIQLLQGDSRMRLANPKQRLPRRESELSRVQWHLKEAAAILSRLEP